MKKHMTSEEVRTHGEAVLAAMRTQHAFTLEQCRRICTDIVRRIGSLKKAKEEDLQEVKPS